jgi:hypothetical protein
MDGKFILKDRLYGDAGLIAFGGGFVNDRLYSIVLGHGELLYKT